MTIQKIILNSRYGITGRIKSDISSWYPNVKENNMITAKEAREIFENSAQLIDIHNKIIDAAENGRRYVTVINPSVSVVEKLKELGYTVEFNPQPLDFTISW